MASQRATQNQTQALSWVKSTTTFNQNIALPSVNSRGRRNRNEWAFYGGHGVADDDIILSGSTIETGIDTIPGLFVAPRLKHKGQSISDLRVHVRRVGAVGKVIEVLRGVSGEILWGKLKEDELVVSPHVGVVSVDPSELYIVGEVLGQGGAFEPSSELIAYIDQGILQYTSSMKIEERKAVINAFRPLESERTKKEQFYQVLRDLISTIAFFQLDGILEKDNVTRDRRFNIEFQDAFLDSFPLAPVDVNDFQSLLRRELISYLIFGGKIEGGWGSLAVENGELVIVHNEANRVSSDDTSDDWELAVPKKR